MGPPVNCQSGADVERKQLLDGYFFDLPATPARVGPQHHLSHKQVQRPVSANHRHRHRPSGNPHPASVCSPGKAQAAPTTRRLLPYPSQPPHRGLWQAQSCSSPGAIASAQLVASPAAADSASAAAPHGQATTNSEQPVQHFAQPAEEAASILASTESALEQLLQATPLQPTGCRGQAGVQVHGKQQLPKRPQSAAGAAAAAKDNDVAGLCDDGTFQQPRQRPVSAMSAYATPPQKQAGASKPATAVEALLHAHSIKHPCPATPTLVRTATQAVTKLPSRPSTPMAQYPDFESAHHPSGHLPAAVCLLEASDSGTPAVAASQLQGAHATNEGVPHRAAGHSLFVRLPAHAVGPATSPGQAAGLARLLQRQVPQSWLRTEPAPCVQLSTQVAQAFSRADAEDSLDCLEQGLLHLAQYMHQVADECPDACDMEVQSVMVKGTDCPAWLWDPEGRHDERWESGALAGLGLSVAAGAEPALARSLQQLLATSMAAAVQQVAQHCFQQAALVARSWNAAVELADAQLHHAAQHAQRLTILNQALRTKVATSRSQVAQAAAQLHKMERLQAEAQLMRQRWEISASEREEALREVLALEEVAIPRLRRQRAASMWSLAKNVAVKHVRLQAQRAERNVLMHGYLKERAAREAIQRAHASLAAAAEPLTWLQDPSLAAREIEETLLDSHAAMVAALGQIREALGQMEAVEATVDLEREHRIVSRLLPATSAAPLTASAAVAAAAAAAEEEATAQAKAASDAAAAAAQQGLQPQGSRLGSFGQVAGHIRSQLSTVLSLQAALSGRQGPLPPTDEEAIMVRFKRMTRASQQALLPALRQALYGSSDVHAAAQTELSGEVQVLKPELPKTLSRMVTLPPWLFPEGPCEEGDMTIAITTKLQSQMAQRTADALNSKVTQMVEQAVVQRQDQARSGGRGHPPPPSVSKATQTLAPEMEDWDVKTHKRVPGIAAKAQAAEAPVSLQQLQAEKEQLLRMYAAMYQRTSMCQVPMEGFSTPAEAAASICKWPEPASAAGRSLASRRNATSAVPGTPGRASRRGSRDRGQSHAAAVASLAARRPTIILRDVAPRSSEWLLRLMETVYKSYAEQSKTGSVVSLYDHMVDTFVNTYGTRDLVSEYVSCVGATLRKYERGDDLRFDMFSKFLNAVWGMRTLSLFLHAQEAVPQPVAIPFVHYPSGEWVCLRKCAELAQRLLGLRGEALAAFMDRLRAKSEAASQQDRLEGFTEPPTDQPTDSASKLGLLSGNSSASAIRRRWSAAKAKVHKGSVYGAAKGRGSAFVAAAELAQAATPQAKQAEDPSAAPAGQEQPAGAPVLSSREVAIRVAEFHGPFMKIPTNVFLMELCAEHHRSSPHMVDLPLRPLEAQAKDEVFHDDAAGYTAEEHTEYLDEGDEAALADRADDGEEQSSIFDELRGQPMQLQLEGGVP